MSSSGLLLGLLVFFVSQYQHGAIACKHGEVVPKNTLMTWYPADDCNICECWKGAWDCSHYECISGGPKDEKLGSFNGSLYTFLKERRSWDGVRRFCQENGGDLAVINSTEEGNDLKEIVKDKGLVGPYDRIFIGASASSGYYGEWTWVNEEPLSLTNENWDRHPEWVGRACLGFMVGRMEVFKWADYDCGRNANAICEKPAPS